MFDRNPKASPADRYIAGKTTEQVVRACTAALTAAAADEVAHVDTGEGSLAAVLILAALVGRFDRKAERRAA